jgi:hypothetical protein
MILLSLNKGKAEEHKINAYINIGDIFPVEVERVDENEDRKTFTKSKSIEFWAIKIYPELQRGELLVITQAAVPGQRYPLYNIYPLKDIKDLGGGKIFTTAQQDGIIAALNPRKIIIEMSGSFISSVTATLQTKSALSGRSIEKKFRNITDKNFELYIDKP